MKKPLDIFHFRAFFQAWLRVGEREREKKLGHDAVEALLPDKPIYLSSFRGEARWGPLRLSCARSFVSSSGRDFFFEFFGERKCVFVEKFSRCDVFSEKCSSMYISYIYLMRKFESPLWHARASNENSFYHRVL